VNIDEYEHLVLRALELGVPADVVAQLFELPLDTAEELQREIRVERFGTDDITKYLEGIQFLALEQAERMLRSGSTQDAVKIVSAVFGRQIQAAGKRPSRALEESREDLMEMFAGVRDGPAQGAQPGRFVLANTGVDRRANRDEEDDG
jgi:hypothetical protein